MAGRARWRGRTFSSLSVPSYRTFFIGNTASVVGTWMQRIGQDWLVLELTDSALALGGAMFCQFLPVLLGALWGGVVVDRVDTRRLLIATQSAQAALAVALAAFALTGTATLLIVYALAVGLGITTVFDNPGRHAFVAELVGADHIINAQALTSLINNLGRLVGPALAGILIATAGVGVTFVVNAVSFVAVLVGLVRIDPRSLHRQPVAPRARRQVRDGLAYVWGHPELRATLVLAIFVSVFGQNTRVVFPVLAAETFDGDATVYGWLTAALGLGAVFGALASARARTATSWRLLMIGLAFAAANFAVAVAPGLPAALVTIAVLGVGNILFNTMTRSILILGTVSHMRGRVMAISMMVFLGGIPIGGPLIGWLCELWGPRAGMGVGGAMSLVGCAVVWRTLSGVRAGRIDSHPEADSPPTTDGVAYP